MAIFCEPDNDFYVPGDDIDNSLEPSEILINKITDSYKKNYKIWKDCIIEIDDIFGEKAFYVLALQNVLSWININILRGKNKFLEYYLQPDNKIYLNMMLALDDFVMRLYQIIIHNH